MLLDFLSRDASVTNRLVKNISFPPTKMVYRSFRFLGHRLISYDVLEVHKNWLSFLISLPGTSILHGIWRNSFHFNQITQNSVPTTVFIWLCTFISLFHYMLRSKMDHLQVEFIIFIINFHFIYVHVSKMCYKNIRTHSHFQGFILCTLFSHNNYKTLNILRFWHLSHT
jgi:hypothetical protein